MLHVYPNNLYREQLFLRGICNPGALVCEVTLQMY